MLYIRSEKKIVQSSYTQYALENYGCKYADSNCICYDYVEITVIK